MKESILNNLNICIFSKDKNLKYLYCNESLAEAAGLDSPSQIRGKTDYQLVWRDHADFYKAGDFLVLNGGTRINAPEVQTQSTKIANILITKNLLQDKKGHSIGVVGSYIDITGYSLKKNKGHFEKNGKKFYLGDDFNSEYLTQQEIFVFRYILLGWSTEKISTTMYRSKKTIESHIEKIKNKLQCSSKNEIAPRAIDLGLTYILECPPLFSK